MILRLLALSLVFQLVLCDYPDLGHEQFVAPPGLPPAMAPHDKAFDQPPQKDYNEVHSSQNDAYLVQPPTHAANRKPAEQEIGPEGSAASDSSGEKPDVTEGHFDGSGENIQASGEGSGVKDEEMDNIMKEMANVAHETGVACPADILFVIDSTSSVKGIFEQYKTYVTKVIQGLTISNGHDRVGVVLFAGPKVQREKIKLGQINDSGKLISTIKGLPFLSGITATGAALNFAKSSLVKRRKDVPTVVIVITDGFSYDLTGHAAKQLRTMDNVHVYTVSFGGPYVEKELIDMAGDRTRFLHGENSYGQLVNIIKNCPAKAKSLPRLETSTVRHIETATDSQGRHLIPNPILTNKGYKHFDDRKEAAVHGNAAQSQNLGSSKVPTGKKQDQSSGRNRQADSPPPSCQNDIVIVFDASGSTKSNFDVQLKLANEVVDKFVVGPKDTQFAAIKFAGKAHCRVLFNFTDYSDKDRLQTKINGTSFISGITATNEALMKALNLFDGPEARKGQAKPILILFTDGFSSESPVKAATYLHKKGVTVFVVGIGQKPEQVYMEELKMIATDSAHLYLLSNFEKFLVDLEILGKNCIHH